MSSIPLTSGEPYGKVPTLFILKNVKPKQIGINRLCHWLDWRIDFYFIGWTIWLEDVDYGMG